jgi:uncharacterized Zn finger protein (UPF0148 family)
VSLFDRDDVAPPEECSRCGKLVVRTSLFCPQCGQSRVNPLPKQVVVETEPPVTEEPESPEQESESEEEQKRSTLSRTTDWIIKNITRVGQGGQDSTHDDESPERGLEADEASKPQRTGGRTSSWPERLQQSSRAQARFVLLATDGRQFTLGEALSGIGSAESAPHGEEMLWISLTASDNSVDAFHLRCGVEDGLFWIEDANSIMGTVISEPGRAPLQCIPFERYFLVRGSDLQLGSVVLTLQ